MKKTSSILAISVILLSAFSIVAFFPSEVQALDLDPPTITVLLPENGTWCLGNDVALNFTIDEPVSWIGYSLDGTANVTITGNVTLMSLSYGPHNVIVYANDTSGNMGSSITVHFTVTFRTDLSMDGYVGIDDLTYIAEHFGESPGRPRWDPTCELSGDNYIGIDDILLVARDFGKTWI